MLYCVTFDIFRSQGKIKIDYGFVPVVLKDGEFHSTVSKEIFKDLKKKKNYYLKYNRKNGFYFQIILEDNEDFETAEKEIIPVVEKIIRKKIIFNFKFKNKLKERVKRILN